MIFILQQKKLMNFKQKFARKIKDLNIQTSFINIKANTRAILWKISYFQIKYLSTLVFICH